MCVASKETWTSQSDRPNQSSFEVTMKPLNTRAIFTPNQKCSIQNFILARCDFKRFHAQRRTEFKNLLRKPGRIGSVSFLPIFRTKTEIDNIKQMEEMQMSEKPVKISILSKQFDVPVSTIHSWIAIGYHKKKLAYTRVGKLKKVNPNTFKTFLWEIQK